MFFIIGLELTLLDRFWCYACYAVSLSGQKVSFQGLSEGIDEFVTETSSGFGPATISELGNGTSWLHLVTAPEDRHCLADVATILRRGVGSCVRASNWVAVDMWIYVGGFLKMGFAQQVIHQACSIWSTQLEEMINLGCPSFKWGRWSKMSQLMGPSGEEMGNAEHHVFAMWSLRGGKRSHVVQWDIRNRTVKMSSECYICFYTRLAWGTIWTVQEWYHFNEDGIEKSHSLSTPGSYISSH